MIVIVSMQCIVILHCQSPFSTFLSSIKQILRPASDKQSRGATERSLGLIGCFIC